MDFRKIRTTDQIKREVVRELEEGRYVTGPYIERVEEMMRTITGCKFAIATDSGTSALKIALLANGIKENEQVLIPDLTFIASAVAVKEIGAVPMFCDVDAKTGLINWDDADSLLDTDDYYAVMPVALGGSLPDVPERMEVPVILDCAHYLGPVQHDACFSFHPSKIISSLGGGCYVTNDPHRAELARRLRMFGFEEGTRKTEQVIGTKGYMSNVSAVVAFHNLLDWPEIRKARHSIKSRLKNAPGRVFGELGMYLTLVNDPDNEELTHNGFIRHWPMTLSEMFYRKAWCPVAKQLTENMISTPFHEYMTDAEVDAVIELLEVHAVR